MRTYQKKTVLQDPIYRYLYWDGQPGLDGEFPTKPDSIPSWFLYDDHDYHVLSPANGWDDAYF